MVNKKSGVRIRLLTISTATLMLATGFKVAADKHEKEEISLNGEPTLEEELAVQPQCKDTDIIYNEACDKLIANYQAYDVNDVQEIDGKTIYFVTEITPVPTEEPIQEEILPEYTDVTSDEYIMQEDGYLHDTELSLEFYSTNAEIDFYCKVFQLNDSIVGPKIYEFINENQYDWEYNNKLNGVEYTSQEEAIARTLADISLFPGDYGFEEEDIRVEEYELDDYVPEELIYKFSEVIGVNPNIALAVAYGESGTALNSANFKNNYNVGGLHKRSGDPSPTTSQGYTIFLNQADGLFRFILVLHDNFYVTEDSGIDKIKSMASTYCEIPDYWKNLVGSIYYNLEDYGYSYYYDQKDNDRDLIYPKETTEYTK